MSNPIKIKRAKNASNYGVTPTKKVSIAKPKAKKKKTIIPSAISHSDISAKLWDRLTPMEKRWMRKYAADTKGLATEDKVFGNFLREMYTRYPLPTENIRAKIDNNILDQLSNLPLIPHDIISKIRNPKYLFLLYQNFQWGETYLNLITRRYTTEYIHKIELDVDSINDIQSDQPEPKMIPKSGGLIYSGDSVSVKGKRGEISGIVVENEQIEYQGELYTLTDFAALVGSIRPEESTTITNKGKTISQLRKEKEKEIFLYLAGKFNQYRDRYYFYAYKIIQEIQTKQMESELLGLEGFEQNPELLNIEEEMNFTLPSDIESGKDIYALDQCNPSGYNVVHIEIEGTSIEEQDLDDLGLLMHPNFENLITSSKYKKNRLEESKLEWNKNSDDYAKTLEETMGNLWVYLQQENILQRDMRDLDAFIIGLADIDIIKETISQQLNGQLEDSNLLKFSPESILGWYKSVTGHSVSLDKNPTSIDAWKMILSRLENKDLEIIGKINQRIDANRSVSPEEIDQFFRGNQFSLGGPSVTLEEPSVIPEELSVILNEPSVVVEPSFDLEEEEIPLRGKGILEETMEVPLNEIIPETSLKEMNEFGLPEEDEIPLETSEVDDLLGIDI